VWYNIITVKERHKANNERKYLIMRNYSLNTGYYNTLVEVKPYNTNRNKNKVSPSQLLVDILNNGSINSDIEAIKIARKIVNANKINAKIDKNEYLISVVKRLLREETEIGDFATKNGFADVVRQMKEDDKFTRSKTDIHTTTVTYLALNDLVAEGIFIKKTMKNPNRTWKDGYGDMHYDYVTVYERVK
jgi:hypothetical protein